MKHVKKFAALSLLIAAGMLSCSSSEPHPPILGDLPIVPIHRPIVDAGRPIDASHPVVIDATTDTSPDVYYDAALDTGLDTGPDTGLDSGFDATPDVVDAGLDASEDAMADSAIPDNGIHYHGGAVYVNPMKVHLIWYGTWAQSQKDIITGFLTNLNQSDWFKMNDTYYNSAGEKVTSSIVIDGVTEDPTYSLGHALSEGSIQQLALNTLADGGTFDSDKIYLVLGSGDVTQTMQGYSFCSSFCGWHYYMPNGPVSMKYSFVGNPTACLDSCAWQQAASPNGDVGVDGMLSVIAHELSEAATDPNIDAWYDDATGMENADKCAWTFGNTYNVGDAGALANVNLNGKDYLIQQNWVNANGGYCSLK
jgi:hypothetical protein